MGQLDGHCLCGSVTYQCDEEPVATLICHCTDCQHQSGSPFSVVVGVERDKFNIEGDTIAEFTTVGEDTGEPVHRHFCSACGSTLLSVAEATPDMVWIKAGTLDDYSWLEPEMEIWARSKHPYVAPDEENRGVFERSVPF